MKSSFLICFALFVFLLNMSCVKEEQAVETNVSATKEKGDWDRLDLDNYFKKNEIQPTAVFYNQHDRADVLFFNHRFSWINKDGNIRLNIDGNIFNLDKEITVNAVWGSGPDSINFANDWDEMKYYKFQDRELIGIRMYFNPCNGLGCSANYFLWYDLKKQAKNYFGTFRVDNKLALYSFNNNESIDYVSGTFIGDANGETEMSFIVELYSLNDEGIFVLQKDINGSPYQIKHTTYPNDTTGTDRVTEHWFEEISK